MHSRWPAVIGAVYGFLGVALGAFAAHLLRGRLTPQELAWVETGSRYLLIHGVALTAVAWSLPKGRARQAIATCWTFGGLIFCGSLLLLALGAGRFWGAVTPIGGALLLAGWAILTVKAIRSNA